MTTSGRTSRSDLVVTLIVDAADVPKMTDPPLNAFVASPRPVMILAVSVLVLGLVAWGGWLLTGLNRYD